MICSALQSIRKNKNRPILRIKAGIKLYGAFLWANPEVSRVVLYLRAKAGSKPHRSFLWANPEVSRVYCICGRKPAVGCTDRFCVRKLVLFMFE